MALVTSEESFRLGKEKTHQLTQIPSQLRVEINTTFAGYRYTNYSNFTVTNEASNYTLFIGFYSGTATDEVTYHSSRLLLLRTVIVTKREVTTVRWILEEPGGTVVVTMVQAWITTIEETLTMRGISFEVKWNWSQSQSPSNSKKLLEKSLLLQVVKDI